VYNGDHGAIVIGKGGTTVQDLQQKHHLALLRAIRDDDGTQYFIIKGPNERDVHNATIRVQELLMISMQRQQETLAQTMEAERSKHSASSEQVFNSFISSHEAFPALIKKMATDA
tara:strand:+ start:32 stop:376 length:345 start_codon:yes stop_codon:yes gene_type:complete